MRFRDKTVWITGASSGIGEALVRAFHAERANVVLSARRREELERVAAACPGGRTTIIPLDVTDETAVRKAAAAALERLGRIDILVNNAGLTQRAAVADADLSVFRRVMDVNFFGPLMLTKAVLPHMMERGAGHIVAVTSVAGKYGSPGRSGYCAAKHAAHGLFDSLRAEVERRGVKVTLAVPGPVRTDISRNALTADGTPWRKMDSFLERGLDPGICAARILDAVHAGRRETLIAGGATRRYALLKRLSPWLLSRAVSRRS